MKLVSEKIPRIIKNRKRLERILNVKITNNGKEVTIEGTPEEEYESAKVIDALGIGFPFSVAISIKEEENLFEILNIKEHTKKHNLESVRGRIIGKNGKALSTISKLTNCHIEINGNQVGVIGNEEDIEFAMEALIQLIQGSKHSNVYKGLEKREKDPLADLGLKGGL